MSFTAVTSNISYVPIVPSLNTSMPGILFLKYPTVGPMYVMYEHSWAQLTNNVASANR